MYRRAWRKIALSVAFVDLVMQRDGERPAATGQELPADFDVAAFLVDFLETELREDFENVLPGERLKLWHGWAGR